MDYSQYGYPSSPIYSSSSSSQGDDTASQASHKRKSGRKKFTETRHPIYRGVRQRNGAKWVSEIRDRSKKNSSIWLGTFPTPGMAARAYDVAALALRGKSAPLNFVDSAWLLPRPKSSSAQDIKLAASEAAQAFAPTATSSSSSSSPMNLRVPVEPSSMFWDEEAMFNMPSLLDNMAEGMLLTPPSMQERFSCEDVDFNMELSLWND
uniref:DREB1/CBF transcription factor n=1 Tax=Adonis amurensis TaxID=196574 RepID=F1DQZ8_9MAGN|nr:DREB1/CBF transcription factor [Adonis amurensis]